VKISPLHRAGFFVCVLLFLLFENNYLFGQALPDSISKKYPSANPLPGKDSVQKKQPAASLPEPHAIVLLEFVKEKTEQGPDSVYFNILKITNKNGNAIQGSVKISVPYGWKLISQEETAVTISPGNTEYIPVRVAMSRSVLGGVSYIVSATLNATRSLNTGKNQTSVSKACYISVPQKRNWDVFPVQRSVYFDRYSEYSPVKMKLINKGNGAEVVKLEFEVGSSLAMFGAIGNRYFTSLELRPHSDTVITFPVKYMPRDESDLWNRDFRKLTVRVTATVDTVAKRSSVSFKYLESAYYNMLADKLTPLTIEMQLQNLLSEATPRVLLAAYGVILLKNDDVIDYNARFNNLPFNNYGTSNYALDYLWRRSLLSAGYKSARWSVKIGDNVGSYGSGFLGSVGRGIGGAYQLNSTNSVGGAFTAAMGAPIYSANIFHQTILRKSIPLISSLNTIIDNYNRINAFGLSVQSNYSFGPHNISVLLAPAILQHNYNNQSFVDANGNFIVTNDPGVTRFGMASRIGYGLNLKKVTASLNVFFATKNYWQSYSGKLDLNGTAQYFIDKKYSLVASSGLFFDNPHRYNRGVLFPESNYFSGTHRIELASRMTNKLTLFTGPVVEHFSYSAVKTDNVTGLNTFTRFSTISPKLSIRCSYKNGLSGSINPYGLFGYTVVTAANDSTINVPSPFIPHKTFFNSKVGVNIIQSYWGMNVLYYIGPQNLASQRDYYYFGRYSKSIRIMPYFQKYYFNKTLLFSSYDSYAYEVLSNNERIALNARLQFFLGRDWTVFVDNNLFMSSSINVEGQKVYSRSFFLNVGVKKVFDIPQPRVKYYNLKIVCFKDGNGNQVKDENEQGLSDIVISIDREMQTDSVLQKVISPPGQFAPAEMVTDNFGSLAYYHIPEGEFNVKVFPLLNLKNLFNVNGQKQKISLSHDTTYYIPFVQSYRVLGNVILNRDEFTSSGVVSTANIRVTATDSMGNSFPTLTSGDGSYVLYVPRSGEYKVTINKVFGDLFALQEPEYTVNFDGAKEFHVDFIFNEKKRPVNFNGAATTIDTLLGRKFTSFIVAGKDTLKDAVLVEDTLNAVPVAGKALAKQNDSSIPVGPGISYRVQLRASPVKIPSSEYATVFKGVKNIFEYYENGNYKYTVGEFATLSEAKTLKMDLRRRGFRDAFMVPFYKGLRVRY
jgi:hypothetical protein